MEQNTRKRGGLGRGLESLLSQPLPNKKEIGDAELRSLPIAAIVPGKYQPRREIKPEALEDLANSIKSQGIIQPIVVRMLRADQYEIVAGERRWRAAQLAGLTEIPALVRKIPDETAVAVALIENIQREDLNPLDEAIALQRLIDEFSMTHQQLAQAVGKSRASISNMLRLLGLNEDVKKLLAESKLEMGHARALLGLTGSAQSLAAQKIVAQGMSVRETEALVKKHLHPTFKSSHHRESHDVHVTRLQKKLADKLGMAVSIKQGRIGKVLIQYRDLHQLKEMLEELV